MIKSKSWDVYWVNRLKDTNFAMEYLFSVLDDCKKRDEEDKKVLMAAVGSIMFALRLQEPGSFDTEWIRCEDRMPEIDTDVLVFEPFIMYVTRREDVNWEKRKKARKKEKYPEKIEWYSPYFSQAEPTHWRKLPEFPEEITFNPL